MGQNTDDRWQMAENKKQVSQVSMQRSDDRLFRDYGTMD